MWSFNKSLYIVTAILVSGYSSVLAQTEGSIVSKISESRVLPMIYYSNPDHVFAGVKFRISKGRLGANTEGFEQSVQLRYSISQNAFSILYDAKFNQLFGQWNASANAYYDWLIWTNFFGLGNETQKTEALSYYRMSTSEYALRLGINRVFSNYNYVELSTNIQGVEVFKRDNTFVTDYMLGDRTYYFEHHNYTGIRADYTFQYVDDPTIPTRGVMLYAGAGFTLNMGEPEKNFAKFNGIAQFYIPLSNKFSLSLRAGGTAMTGTPEFYQYVSVGGPMTIRGYYRDRFWGNESFYNQNEIRYITNFKPIRGKIGLLAFYDQGRVWLDNEHSNTMHSGYGGGLIVCPLNKVTGSITYGKSSENGLVQIKVAKLISQIHGRSKETAY